MKKLVAILLVSILLLSALAGCGQNEETIVPGTDPVTGEPAPNPIVVLPEGMSGVDASKLILANERLNSQLFKDGDSIFVSGPAVFESLAAIADENMVKYSYSNDQVATIRPLSASTAKKARVSPLALLDSDAEGELNIVPTASTKYESKDGSVVEVDGNTYKWSNFSEYSNSYDYFLNITKNVKLSAEMGANLIDNTKKFVRVVDKWVNVGGTEFYLHVEDDMEIIYSRYDDMQEICKRYKREDGVNVYELYRFNDDGGSTKMIYIPGQKYEYSYISSGDFNHNFLAENTKGFWEVADVSKIDVGYNVSSMVIKDDICYDFFYDPTRQICNLIKVISPDRKTDLMYFSDDEGSSMVELQLQGFNGIDHIEITVDPDAVRPNTTNESGTELYYYVDERSGQTVYQSSGAKSCTVVLKKDGMTLNECDEFLDGNVRVGTVLTNHFNKEGDTEGYMGSLHLNITGATYEERMKTLNEFLELTGLECRRDMDTVEAGIVQAYKEIAQMTKYQQWNGSPITTIEDLDRGYANNLADHKAFADMLEALKDAPVIDFEDKEAVELNIKFAPITAQTAASVKNDGLTVSVSDLELSIEDTTLFVVDQAYTVNLAILGTGDNASAGLTHIELAEPVTVKYADEDVFKVKQTVSFEIPFLAAGEYTIVAYISTDDGIRSSGYTDLVFTEVTPYQTKEGNISVAVDKNSAGELVISQVEINDIEVSISLPESGAHTYATMYEALSAEAYKYGFVADGAVIERLGEGDVWSALTGDETAIEDGTYRLKYNIKNGTLLAEGYVYTNYTAPVAE